MSTKTTMNNTSAQNLSTSPTIISDTTTTTATTTIPTATGINIKKELPSSDEIKEFAENTMNELLGWYGFDELGTKTSRLLQTAAAAAGNIANKNINTNSSNNNNNNNSESINININTNSNAQQHQSHMEKRRNRSIRGAGVTLQQLQQHRNTMRNINNGNKDNSSNSLVPSHGCKSTTSVSSNLRNCRNNSGSGLSLLGGTTLCTGNESTNSDHDTRSSREDSKSPLSAGRCSTMDEKVDNQNCCWCRRPVPENAPDFLTISDGPRYCSESCFTQSRRASFKKAKTCDWCKHVRHAVSYVDFQDGASQLQFCSDKCLNQYKMQIFCKETQAHLDMNPHLRDQGIEAAAAGNGAGLITPDLWLRNCRSRSASPASTVSASPPLREPTPNCSYSNHTELQSSSANKVYAPTVQIHKPVISVAPVSKLMSKSPAIISNRQSPKHNRKKRLLRHIVTNSDLPTLTSKPNHPPITRELAGQHNKHKSLSGGGGSNTCLRTSPNGLLNMKSVPPTLNQFAGSSVQDLHMNVPPLSPMLEQPPTPNYAAQSHSHLNTNNACDSTASHPMNVPPNFFATPPSGHMPPTGFPLRGPFLSNAASGLIPPRFLGGPMLPPDINALGALIGAPPPVTVMVPYPIIIPLPIPIPVPLPIIEFHKAYLSPEEREKFKTSQLKKDAVESEQKSTEDTSTKSDEPLDFTKNRDITNEELSPETQKSHRITFTEQKNQSPNESVTSVRYAEVPGNEAEEESGFQVTTTHEDGPEGNRNENLIRSNSQDNDNDDGQQKLPKLKITRLQTKRTLLQQAKESECTRPLRKRKRIIDCDFQKVPLKDNSETEEKQPEESLHYEASTIESVSSSSASAGYITNTSPDGVKIVNQKK